MTGLLARDFDAILDFTLEVRAHESVGAFRGGVVRGLRRLIACDSLGWTEVDLRRGTAGGIVDPADAMFEGIERRFATVMHQHPVVARAATGDGDPYSLSDFLTSRELHRLELYQDLYRLIETEDQLAFSLFGDVIVGIALNRGRRGFSDRDRAVAATLRPHLAQAYAQVRDRELATGVIAALESGLGMHDAAIVILDRAGRLAFISDVASELLIAYFGGPWDGVPPDPKVEAWLASNTAEPLVVDGPRGRLGIRRVQTCDGDRWNALLLDEQGVRPPTLESLCSLGLTKREGQVLRLLSCGKRNQQIAQELFISAATVRKHLEHIYTKLGVATRSEAVARALSRGGDHK